MRSIESIVARIEELHCEKKALLDARSDLQLAGRWGEADKKLPRVCEINEELNVLLRAEHSRSLVGKRIRMVEMKDDPDPIPAGDEGTVTGADDVGHLFVKWDSGRNLHVIPGTDKYEIIT